MGTGTLSTILNSWPAGRQQAQLAGQQQAQLAGQHKPSWLVSSKPSWLVSSKPSWLAGQQEAPRLVDILATTAEQMVV